jgi:uncharacterized protein YkwD
MNAVLPRCQAGLPAALTAALATLLLAACGGGGSDAGAPAAAAAGGASATVAATSAGSTCAIADFAATALARINARRAAGASCGSAGSFAPAPPLVWDALLTQAAEAHTQDMVANNLFSHTGSDGSTLADRVNATGYAWSSLGENIAAGYAGIDAVVTGWMASDGHCANIMNPAFSAVGLVCVPGTAATAYGNYWTMDLARPR